MTKQAQVGAFTIVAFLLLFGVFYVITNFGTRHTGYQMGVHFGSAAGLTSGAEVYFSGVGAGTVDSVKLLPDNTVEVVLAMNREINVPAASRFLIQAPLTGTPAVVIIPPRQKPPIALLPREILPVDQQPEGSNATSIADLLQEGQGEMKRLNSIMALLQSRTPRLLDTLQATLNHADALTSEMLALGANLQGSFGAAGANVAQLSATLNDAASTDTPKLGVMLDRFNATALALDRSTGALQSLATDPRLKSNVLETTENIADTTQTIAALLRDLRTVTSDPQTQAQLRNTVANMDALMQKANSLLGELGGRSNVPGVDTGASPAPGAAGAPPSGNPPELRERLRTKLSTLAHDLVAIQLRLSGLSAMQPTSFNQVLPNSRGPIGDLNLVLLPHASTSVMFGANAIGTKPTWNAVLEQSHGNFRVGAGVLYSQLGVLGQYDPLHGVGLEARIYDLTYPMIDLYGNLRIAPGTQLFFGQRDVNHAGRRNTIGLQYQF